MENLLGKGRQQAYGHRVSKCQISAVSLVWLRSTSVCLVAQLCLCPKTLGAEGMSRYLELILKRNLFVSENKFYLNKMINTLHRTPVTCIWHGTGQSLLAGCKLSGWLHDGYLFQFEMCSLLRSSTLPGWLNILVFLVRTSLS